MKLTTLINEARRNPEVNQTLTPIEQIRYLHNKTGSKISGSVTNLFISMTSLDKLGINPRSKYRTPLGIYSYATDYVIVKVKQNLTDLPFVGDALFVSIFKATDPNSVLVLNDMTTSDVDFYLSKIMSIQEFAAHVPRDTYAARTQTPGGIFWYITMKIAEKVANITNRRVPVMWNIIFRKLGITGCVDTGAGIIHPAEKAQAVFFSIESVSVISRINNKMVDSRDQLKNVLNAAIRLGYSNRKPEIEKVLARSPEFAYEYALTVIQNVWPAGEAAIARDAFYSYLYATKIVDGPFPAGEAAIATSPEYSYNYASLIGQFPAGEAAIATRSDYAYGYAEIIGTRFPLGEPEIAKNALLADSYGVHILNGKKVPAWENLIKNYPKQSFGYAYRVIDEPFPAGEPAISTDTILSAMYVTGVLTTHYSPTWEHLIKDKTQEAYHYAMITKKRFPAGEAAIAADPSFAKDYDETFGTNLSQQ